MQITYDKYYPEQHVNLVLTHAEMHALEWFISEAKDRGLEHPIAEQLHKACDGWWTYYNG